MQKVILSYFIFINIIAFFIYSYDKFLSMRKGSSRVSEKELHAFSLIGGFLGATLSMAIFRHKVSKSSFLIKHIFIMLIWIVAAVYYFTEINKLNFLR
jgi:uncharacterized membrane protein YsdA (DUF1294 family)